MNTTQQLGKHLKEVNTGGNWTCVNISDTLKDVNFEMATKKTNPLNTIAALTFHIHYYIKAVTEVLEGRPLNAHDKYSYDLPELTDTDWQKMKADITLDFDKLAVLISQLPDEKLNESFTEEKYGTYFRNMLGLIEHTHYHLGQIALIKKLIESNY